jgi:hypothetical protein
MTYSTPFRFLTDAQLDVLVENENTTYQYITALALLHGFLNPYSTNLLLPSVLDYAQATPLILFAIEDISLTELQGVITTNYNTTMSILTFAATKENQDKAAVSRVVDSFMKALADQYNFIRARSLPIAETAAAASG